MLNIAVTTILCAIIGAVVSQMKFFGHVFSPLKLSQVQGALLGGAAGVLLAFSLSTNFGSGALMTVHAERAEATEEVKGSVFLEIASEEVFNKKVLEYKGKSVAYFWAPWCPACISFKPTLESVSGNFQEEMQFVKVNVDKGKAISEKQHIEYLPTLILYENGKEVSRFIGAESESALTKRLKTFLNKDKGDLT